MRKSNLDGTKNDAQIIEGYIDFRFNQSDLRVGQQIISWGRADIVNPISIGRQDFSDPLDIDNNQLGQLAANFRHYFTNWEVETLWLPIYQSSTLPNMENPWFGVLPIHNENGQTLQYSLKSTNNPSTKLNHSQIGLRLTTMLDGWDMGISYFNGWNDVPIYQTIIGNIHSDQIDLQLVPSPYRQQKLGVDAATTFGSMTARFEYAYIHTNDTKGVDDFVDDPYSHLVVGIDQDISNRWDDLTSRLLLEYSRQFKTTDIQYTPQDLDHIFEDTVFFQFSIEAQPVWSIELDAAYDLKNDGQLVRPRFNYNIQDDLKLAVSFEWLEGSKDSFFGNYRNNQSFRMTLSHDSLIF